jgi:hypothetical protein
MTTVIVILSLAYAAVAALLLNLNLATPWSGAVKIGAIVLVSGLYVGTWQGHQGLLGWATPDAMPEEFRVHWITIDEPDKQTGADGSIFFWVRELDQAGLPVSEPRAHRVPWDQATAEAAQAALETLEKGEPLNGRMSRQVMVEEEPLPQEGLDYQGAPTLSGSDGFRPQFEFSRVPRPKLPPKSVPDA